MSNETFELTQSATFYKNQTNIIIGADSRLTLHDAKLIAKRHSPISLSTSSPAAIERSFLFLKSCIDQRIAIYGLNTHFGDQVSFLDSYIKNSTINPEHYYESINARQENLIKSHACGLGQILSPEVVRVAMMLRAHCLAQGYSGVTYDAVQAIINYINSGIVPMVRCYGSIGASGDLIPLATIAAGIAGENVDVLYQNVVMPASQAIQLAGLEKFKPKYRDGLAMINGTSLMTAIASIALYKIKRLFKQMLCVIGMSLESMQVIESSFHPLVHQLKRHLGENQVNHFLLNFWSGSQLLTNLDELRSDIVSGDLPSETQDQKKSVQDYYSLRAVAQGFGPFQENLERAIVWIEDEMNSINDNPIIDAIDQKIHHSANFMGYYVTDASDILKINIAQASTWIHALLANMVHPRKNNNLPANLVLKPGVNNGFRPLQLLAASLAVQNRKLAQCHQAFMLPTEGDNQDVNSLGTHAALDLQESVDNLERLTAILLLASVQALELRGITKACKKAQDIYEIVRRSVNKVADCRPLTHELEITIGLLEQELF